MRGQLSIFIIVGIVALASVAILVTITMQARTPEPQPEIAVDEARAHNCLAQSTRQALSALRDDAAISEEPTLYLTHDQPQQYPAGRNTYVGLCSRNGPNAAEAGYSCPQKTYTSGESIQDQLTKNIREQMTQCVGEPGNAEVIMQQDAVLVRWDNPELQYSHEAALTSAWAAAAEIVRREVSESDYQPPQTLQGCARCEEVTIQKSPDKVDAGGVLADNYTLSVRGTAVTSILLQDRGVAVELHPAQPDPGYPSIQERESVEFYKLPLNDVCPPAGCEFTVYSLDGDELELEYEEPEQTCGPASNVHCGPTADIAGNANGKYTITIHPECDDKPIDLPITDNHGNTLTITDLRTEAVYYEDGEETECTIP